MAPEQPDVRTLEVRGWLLRASEVLRAGRHDLTASPPLLNDVAFHSQQCAEKSMKALLVHREHPFRKTHNLTELGGAVARLEPGMTDLMRRRYWRRSLLCCRSTVDRRPESVSRPLLPLHIATRKVAEPGQAPGEMPRYPRVPSPAC